MKKVAALALVLLLACFSAHAEDAKNWTIIPGKSIGPVPWSANEKDFIKAFGKNAVRDKVMSDQGTDSDMEDGLVLFPNDQLKRLEISWQNAKKHSKVRHVSMRLQSSGKNPGVGAWKIDNGLQLGLGTNELQTLNGKPFKLAFTGNESGNYVTDWDDGKLGAFVGYILFETPEGNKIEGGEDKSYSSDDKTVQAADPWISIIDFYSTSTK